MGDTTETEGAQYRVKELSLIGNELVSEGTVIGAGTKHGFDGLPGGNLEPLNAAAEAKFAEAKKATDAASAILEATYGDKTGKTDTVALSAMIVAAVQAGNADLAAENADLKARLEAIEKRQADKGEVSLG
jgi:hypothetical protein